MQAVVFREPLELELGEVALPEPGAGEVLVEVDWSGISTGTERLLWTGDMPPFPGHGLPVGAWLRNSRPGARMRPGLPD